MKRLKKVTIVLAVATLLLAGGLAFVLFSHMQEYKWEYYDAATSRLFEELGKTNKVKSQDGILITGIAGIPWAEGTDDIVEGDVLKPAKRYLQVFPDDVEAEVYVVTFFAPSIREKGFAGVFRQIADDVETRMFSCSICYAPGMVIATCAFPESEAELDKNAFVSAEMGVMAQVQEIIDAME